MNLCIDTADWYFKRHTFDFDIFLNLKINAIYHKHRTIIIYTNFNWFETIGFPIDL